MNLDNIFSTKITILKKSKSGKILQKIVTSNTLTYTGADMLARALSQRGTLDLDLLHIRFAQNESDAFATGTAFAFDADIKAAIVSDFEDTTGTAGGGAVALTSLGELEPTSVNYQGNKVSFNFSLAVADLTDFVAGSSQIYSMGLGVSDSESPYSSIYLSGGVSIFSVLNLSESDRFTLTGGQQADVAYDISILA